MIRTLFNVDCHVRFLTVILTYIRFKMKCLKRFCPIRIPRFLTIISIDRAYPHLHLARIGIIDLSRFLINKPCIVFNRYVVMIYSQKIVDLVIEFCIYIYIQMYYVLSIYLIRTHKNIALSTCRTFRHV